jgi:hypothetical protein
MPVALLAISLVLVQPAAAASAGGGPAAAAKKKAKKCKKAKSVFEAKKKGKRCKRPATPPTDPNTPPPEEPTPPDADSDGVLDASDNCPTVANADQSDGDGDDKGDACDACPAESNPGATPCTPGLASLDLGDNQVCAFAIDVGSVTLSGPAPVDTFVGLSSSDPTALLVGDGVTVPQGQSSSTFGIAGFTQGATVTVFATLGTVQLQGNVTVTAPCP